MKHFFPTVLAALAFSVMAPAQPYLDRSLSPEERADDLISRLTIEEKASLMMNSSAAIERLGIKQYNWWNEALHGVARNGSATVFPQAIGMAASFDDELIYEVFTAVSDEARVKNQMAVDSGKPVRIYQGLTFWTPNINIFRDPRWGRGMETYGEDPYLTGRLGIAVVRGLQGPDDSPVRKAHACAKHYAVHSGPESNRHSFDVSVSDRDLYETYLPAFKDLVTKAGVEEVMTAYNRVDGVPAGASDLLMNKILRDEWGFKGLVTSDCWAVADFYEPGRHGYSPDAVSAVAAAVKAGMDTECGEAFQFIPEAVSRGLLDEADVDRNLKRLLVARYRLGEMDGINPWNSLSADIVEGEEHRALSRKIAGETIVLLQNRGGVLPLAKDAKVALIGPNADDAEMMWGNYNPVPKSTVSLLDAFKERIPDLTYFKACGLLGEDVRPERQDNSFMNQLLTLSEQELSEVAKRYAISMQDIRAYAKRQELFNQSFSPMLDVDAVLAGLEGIDIVVFAGGISPRLEGEEMPVHIQGFNGGDRTDIELPTVQRTLLKALHDAGKKVIFVNFSGSAIGLVPEKESCDAILQAWYPGQEGGNAIADVIFGDVNPSGKLPVTFYKSVDQLPGFENYDMKGHTYRYFEGEPAFAFGHGLSYTTFKYRRARIKNGCLVVKVKNTGKRDGEEVVQLYVSRKGDKEGPIKTLRGFKRVFIPAGKTVTVSIPLTPETFEWWNGSEMTPLKGRYTLYYGGSSDKLRKKSYKLK
ncbi:MAG: glycoside hydrolase family 3 C-terminal domain-containing protein [Bacteroidales bacterium]|nr:glycoside hydrolase family 3 C-terminal domain-containing protein [Bacteroidales bacterium]